MVVGARLNWMLSFGKGKWNPAIKFIQLDVEPQEIDVNVPIAAPVVGDMGLALDAILKEMDGKRCKLILHGCLGFRARQKLKMRNLRNDFLMPRNYRP